MYVQAYLVHRAVWHSIRVRWATRPIGRHCTIFGERSHFPGKKQFLRQIFPAIKMRETN